MPAFYRAIWILKQVQVIQQRGNIDTAIGLFWLVGIEGNQVVAMKSRAFYELYVPGNRFFMAGVPDIRLHTRNARIQRADIGAGSLCEACPYGGGQAGADFQHGLASSLLSEINHAGVGGECQKLFFVRVIEIGIVSRLHCPRIFHGGNVVEIRGERRLQTRCAMRDFLVQMFKSLINSHILI